MVKDDIIIQWFQENGWTKSIGTTSLVKRSRIHTGLYQGVSFIFSGEKVKFEIYFYIVIGPTTKHYRPIFQGNLVEKDVFDQLLEFLAEFDKACQDFKPTDPKTWVSSWFAQ